MDILHRKLLKKGDPVFFLRSSIENPFLYLRFGGYVRSIEIIGDSITYHIEVVRVLERFEIVKRHLNRVRFRLRGKHHKRFIDKFTYSFDVRENTFSDDFCHKYKNYLFDVPALLSFSTREEMNESMNKLNNKILGDLQKFVHITESRIHNNHG